MRILFRGLALVLLVGLFCLPGCPKPGVTPKTRLPPPDPAVSDLVIAAGDRATMVFVVRPHLWSSSRETLKTLARSLPVPPQTIEQIFNAPDLWTAVTRGAEAAAERPLSWPSKLPGWNQNRPIIVALFEPQSSDVTLAARALIPEPLEKEVPGLRHRVLIPSTDPLLTMEALTTLLSAWGIHTGREAVPGGGLLFPFPEGFVAFLPEDGHVRIEILTGEIRNRQDSKVRVADEWKSLVEKKPAAAKLPMTPALHALLTGDDLIAAYIRPWQLRDLMSQIGSQKIVGALAYVDPAQKTALLAAGLAEVATGYLLMSPIGAEVDDVTVGLEASGPIRLRYTQSLTELGEKVYRAGISEAGQPFTVKRKRILARASMPVNIGKILDFAVVPEMIEDAKDIHALFTAFRECGVACYWHAFLRNPMGLLKTLRKYARFETVQHLPLSMDLIVVDVNPQDRKEPFRAVVAARMPKGFDTGWLREALATMEKTMHTGGKTSTHLEMRSQTDHDAVLLGINADPLEVFHIGSRPAEEGLLAEFELDTGLLANILGKVIPRAAAIFDRYTGMKGRTVLSGRALVSELVAGIAGQPAPPWTDPPEYTNMSWPSPGLLKAQSKGGRCLAGVTKNMIEAFKALSYADPAYCTEILAKAMDMTAKEHLQCAKEFEETREEAERIHLLMVMYIDERLKKEFKREERIVHLKKACADGVEEACRREKEVLKEPVVDLARLDVPCGRFPSGELAVAIAPTGAYSPEGSCAIAPDKKVSFDKMAKVFADLSKKNCDHLDVMLKDKNGATRSIPAKLKGPDEVKMPLALNLAVNAVQFVGPGGIIDIKEKSGSLDLDEVKKTLEGIREAFPNATYYLLASAETKWENVAAVLVAASCTEGGPFPVVFGKAPPMPEKPKALKITPGSAEVMGSLSTKAIRQGVRKHNAQFKYCYEKSLTRNPTLEGQVVLKFVIGSDGNVSEASVEETTIKSPELQACMIRAAKRMVFPKPKGGGIVVVNYPFVFKAAK